MVKDKQLYDTLGLSPSCTPTEISTAYRRLALLHHPDKRQSTTIGGDDFDRIQYAHQVLSDEPSRRLYDKYGRIGLAIMQQTGSAETTESLLNPTPLGTHPPHHCLPDLSRHVHSHSIPVQVGWMDRLVLVECHVLRD